VSVDIIQTNATRSPPRAQRIAQRNAEKTVARIVKKTGPRFERRLAEGLGFDFDTGESLTNSPMAAFAACSQCKRPFVQEWAIREAGAMLRAALGPPQAQTQILALIQNTLGCRDESEARALIGLAKSADGADEQALIEYSRECLERNGWRCLPPDQAIHATEGANGRQP